VGSVVTAGVWDRTRDELLSGLVPDISANPMIAGLSDVWVVNEDLMWGAGPGLYTFHGNPCVVDTVSPALGPVGGGKTITITGEGFIAPLKVQFGVGFTSGESVVIKNGGTTIECKLPPGATWASVDVSVTNDNSLPGFWKDQFTYTGAPVITNVFPPVGDAGDTIVISANYLWTDAAGWPDASPPVVMFDGKKASDVTVATDCALVTTIEAKVPAQDPGFTGYVSISVTNPDKQFDIMGSAFSYYSASPLITSINPTGAGTGEYISIRGAGFHSGVTVQFADDEDDLEHFSPHVIFVDEGYLMVRVPAGEGTVDVIVKNPSGGKSEAIFTYLPTVTSIFPKNGPVRGGTTVTILGTNFVDGPGLRVELGLDRATSVEWKSSTRLEFVTADVRLESVSAGIRDLLVLNHGATKRVVMANAFLYDGLPMISSIRLDHGSYLGTNINIHGANIQEGFTAKFGDVDAEWVSHSDSTWVAIKAPVQDPGTWCYITITNPDGEWTSSELMLPVPVVFTFD
jgi:hypothetical protein